MKTVLLGGGTGFVGSAIRSLFVRNGYTVLSVSRKPGSDQTTWDELARNGLPEQCHAVINVAGQNVLDPLKRWTPEFQEVVRTSRIDTTRLLARLIDNRTSAPKVFVTISGVSFYPPSATAEYTEDTSGGNGSDFFSKLSKDWEAAAQLSEDSSNVRQVIIRSGVVLGREGGMIQKLIWPFFLGFGGPVGSGDQYLPWIHVVDLARLFLHAVQNDEVVGVLNGVAPEVVTNRQFARTFASHLWRPAVVPMLGLGLILGTERARMLTEGQRVVPKRTLESGFQFRFPDLDSACRDFAMLIYADKKLYGN